MLTGDSWRDARTGRVRRSGRFGRRPRRLTPSQAAAQAQAAAAPRAERKEKGGAGDRPPLWSPTAGLRLEWHTATMANLSSVFPCHVDDSLGVRGPYMGVDVTGGAGSFHFDPFELYGAGVLTNPNILIFGDVGSGKSTTVKTFLWREHALYGLRRFFAILDPKGEYTALADALGMPVLKLHPGGRDRLNPMDPLPGDDPTNVQTRQGLAAALVAGVLGRPLSETEDAVLGWAITDLARRLGRFTLRDVAGAVSDPPDELAAMARRTPLELAQAATPLVFALDKLCNRTLAGMFDGETTVAIDWGHGPGFVLDLSAVFNDRTALPLVMLAATSWLNSMLARPSPERRIIQVADEIWAAIAAGAHHFQSSLKLSRAYGVSTFLVGHRPGDIVAQSDDGTASAKIAAGLVSDIQTRILMRQPSDQLALATELFGLGERQADILPRLVKGRALWLMKDRVKVVQQVITRREAEICDTDAAMAA